MHCAVSGRTAAPVARKPRATLDVLPMVSPETPAPKFRHTFVRLLGFLRPYRWSLAISIVLAERLDGRVARAAVDHR